MAQVEEKGKNIDVICEHKTDGTIIPLRIRIKDEDGLYQTFMVKSYKDLTQYSDYLGPSERSAANHKWTFDCKILVINREHIVRLFYNAYDNRWKMLDAK